jgi:L-asparaginase II
MLLLARHLELPIETYLDPSHPVQKMIRVTLARFADLPVGEIETAIDGCSAPVFGLPLEAMARSYAQLVGWGHTDLDEPLREAASRVVSAMTEHPEMVGGTSARLDTDLMRATAGALVAKVGAEGVQLLGIKPCPQFPEGLGIAIKIEDGDTRRARDPVAIETLRQLGLLTEEQVHSLERYHRVTLRNHRGIEVGAVQPAFKL